MKIDFEVDGKTLIVKLDGELDYDAANDLKESLSGRLKNIWELVYDFEKLDYTSSAGIRILLENELLFKERGGLRFRNVNETIMKVFTMVGLDKVFIFED